MRSLSFGGPINVLAWISNYKFTTNTYQKVALLSLAYRPQLTSYDNLDLRVCNCMSATYFTL